jgi:hypothetical protein
MIAGHCRRSCSGRCRPTQVVIGANLLKLSERVEERLIVPERHVLDRRLVSLEIRPRESCFARQRTVGHAIQRERLARRTNVIDIIGGFANLLVGRHDEALDDRGIETAPHRDDEVEAHREQNRPEPRGERLVRGEDSADERDKGQQTVRRHARVYVDVGSPEHDARLRRQQARDAQPGAEGQDHEQR